LNWFYVDHVRYCRLVVVAIVVVVAVAVVEKENVVGISFTLNFVWFFKSEKPLDRIRKDRMKTIDGYWKRHYQTNHIKHLVEKQVYSKQFVDIFRDFLWLYFFVFRIISIGSSFGCTGPFWTFKQKWINTFIIPLSSSFELTFERCLSQSSFEPW
jgi:hypothetical protein